MDAKSYIAQMEERIDRAQSGSAFTLSDFTDLMDYETAKKSISRLEKKGTLRRVLRGIYDKPRYSNLLREQAVPDPDRVAHAIARNYNWAISPQGETALNVLGLSTQVPADWSYYSSGPTKEYPLNELSIKFLHRSNREMRGMSSNTLLMIQAIKAIGQYKITDKEIMILRKSFTTEELTLILQEGQNTTRWIYEVIKEICKI